ncbi:MAG TPA: hydrogenase maturation nickel metallochaperone HypA [Ktedonobacterales bacterium]|nr:hydrogenase maturation nickel metallochaperone HypA [Ktedonobacterales bacterium]
MHEVAAITGAVNTALEYMRQAGASRVTNIELEVGAAGHSTEEAIRQYVTMLTANTPAQGTTARIVWLPATYQCLDCGHCFERSRPIGETVCPECEGVVLEMDHQDTCSLSAIDVAFDDLSKPGEGDLVATMLVKEEEPACQA